MHSNPYSICKFLPCNVYHFLSGTQETGWYCIFLRNIWNIKEEQVWKAPLVLPGDCLFWRQVLLSASAKSQAPLPFSPGDTHVPKMWNPRQKGIEKYVTVGATDCQQDWLYCSWWMEKSLKLLWVSLNTVCYWIKQPAITPCAGNQFTVEMVQAEIWLSHRQGTAEFKVDIVSFPQEVAQLVEDA